MNTPAQASLESRLSELADRAQPSPDGWTRIQARARRHDHRRRVAVAAALSVMIVLAAVAAGSRLRSRGHTTTGVTVQGPTGTPTAVGQRLGSAAWVSAGQLWVFSGSGPAQAVAGSSPASGPAWSPDGQWVSYLRRLGLGQSELWVVRADGTGHKKLWSGQLGGFAWSPTADELAVSAAPAIGVGGLSVVTTDGRRRPVVTDAVEVNSFAWSPDGQSIAYSEVVAPAASFRSPLKILAVGGSSAGHTVTAYRATAGDGIVVGGWWPDGRGLLFWVVPQYSKVLEDDGLPLLSIPVSATGSAPLIVTVVYLPWLAWAPDHKHLLVVSGAGPLPSEHKSLTLCTPADGRCVPVPQAPNTVALDPAWSPDGRQVAFVAADRSEAATPAWWATRRLWVANVNDLGGGRPVAGATAGAAVPSWSADGQTIRYTTRRGVEAISAAGGQPEVLSGAAPLIGTPGLDGPTAYGKAGWTGHAVWAP